MADANSSAISNSVAAYLPHVQELYVRLLFSDSCREAWIENPVTVLLKYGIPQRIFQFFPDVNSVSFLVERHGRRVLIAREIMARFPRTLNLLFGRQVTADHFALSDVFKKFIESENFLTPVHSLPHAYGIGRGYESVSKFFLWMRRLDSLDFECPRLEMRKSLYIDFAVHLVTQTAHTTVFPLTLARNGVMFLEHPDDPAFWLMLTPQFVLARVEVETVSTFMSNKCFFLDLVTDTGRYEQPQGLLKM